MIDIQLDANALENIGASRSTEWEFYLLRHGETDLNAEGVLQGSIDAELNDHGRHQAAQAADVFRSIKLTDIISSPQKRALLTAETVAEVVGLPVGTNALLRERNWGEFEGKLRLSRLDDGEGVESLSELHARARQALRDVFSQHGGAPLVVTHSGLIKAMLTVLNCSVPDKLKNCEIIRLTVPLTSAAYGNPPISNC